MQVASYPAAPPPACSAARQQQRQHPPQLLSVPASPPLGSARRHRCRHEPCAWREHCMEPGAAAVTAARRGPGRRAGQGAQRSAAGHASMPSSQGIRDTSGVAAAAPESGEAAAAASASAAAAAAAAAGGAAEKQQVRVVAAGGLSCSGLQQAVRAWHIRRGSA